MMFFKSVGFLFFGCTMVQEATPFSIAGGRHPGAFLSNTASVTASPQSQKSPLRMAGFGGGGSSSSKKKKKTGSDTKKQPLKLKPKSQWDRYNSLKEASPVKVAVRVASSDDSGKWFEVGRIKSEGNEFPGLAVTTQRGIIADHAKRMQPLQFLPNTKMEWSFADDSAGDIVWVAVDKNDSGAPPAGIEKKVGFEGKSEPSGFYSKGLIGSNGPVVEIGNQKA